MTRRSGCDEIFQHQSGVLHTGAECVKVGVGVETGLPDAIGLEQPGENKASRRRSDYIIQRERVGFAVDE